MINKILIFSVCFLFIFLCLAQPVFAKTDLSASETDIVFSSDKIIEGQTIRIYARIFNNGDVDTYGFVMFFANNKEVSQPQPISVRVNNYDDVFVDWKAEAGSFDFTVKIINTNPQDQNQNNDIVAKKNIVVEPQKKPEDIMASQKNIFGNAIGSIAGIFNSQNQQSGQEPGENKNFLQKSADSIKNIFNSVKSSSIAQNDNSQTEKTQKKAETLFSALQNYLDNASQKIKSNTEYKKYFLPALLILLVIIPLFFRRRKR